MVFSKNSKNRSDLLILGFLILSLIGFYTPAKADLIGSEIQISTKEFNQQSPQAVFLPDQNLWFVVWEDERSANSYTCGPSDNEKCGSDIYGQFIKGDGTLCGNEFPLTLGIGDQTNPSVAYDPERKNIYVAWQDSRFLADSGHVYFTSVNISGLNPTDCSGYTLGSEIALGYRTINGENLVARAKPVIKYDPINKKFYLVYVEERDNNISIGANCFGQRSVGYLMGGNTFIGYAEIDAGTGSIPTVDIIRNNLSGYPVTSRLINSSKEPLRETYLFEYFVNIDNPTIGVSTTSNNQIFVFEGIRKLAILTCSCYDNDGDGVCNTGAGDVITFTVTHEDDPENGIKHIYYIEKSRISLGAIHHTAVSKLGTKSNDPDVAYDHVSDRFLVVWENTPDDGNKKIYGQLISAIDGLYGNNILISFSDINGDGQQDDHVAKSKQTNPTVEYDAVNQRFFVAWQDGRNSRVSIENLDLYGQFVDSEGSLRGQNFIINTDPFNQLSPDVAFNKLTQQYLIIWKDGRNANRYDCGSGSQPCGSDIFGQRFTIGQPQVSVLNSDGNVLYPYLIDFGEVESKKGFKEQTFLIKNTGDKNLSIDCIIESGTSNFTQHFEFKNIADELASCDGDTLDLYPNTSYPVTVIFHPQVAGSIQSVITVNSNASQSVEIYLQGIGTITGGNWTVLDQYRNPIPTLNFGEVFVNDKKDAKIMIVNNSSVNNVTISSYTLSDTTNFFILGLNTPLTINPSNHHEFTVSYIPTEAGNHTATLTITDSLGNSYEVKIIGEGTTYKVATDSGTVTDFLQLANIPFVDSKPAGFTPERAFSFKINTGNTTTPQTVNVTITLDKLPSNLALYKIKSDGTWVKISNFAVSGNSITYPILDNGNLDANNQIGIIEDPVAVGSETSGTGDATNPPGASGSNGGCSFGGGSNYTLLSLILILISIIYRRIIRIRVQGK